MVHKTFWLLPAFLVGWGCGPLPERSLCAGQNAYGSSLRISEEDEPGDPLVIAGQAWIGEDRKPLSGLRVIVYHMNAEGQYARDGSGYAGAYLCGVLETDAAGRYRIETLRPGSDPRRRRAAHIHFELTTPWGDRLYDGISLAGDPFLGDVRVEDTWEEVRPVRVDPHGVQHIDKDFWVRY